MGGAVHHTNSHQCFARGLPLPKIRDQRVIGDHDQANQPGLPRQHKENNAAAGTADDLVCTISHHAPNIADTSTSLVAYLIQPLPAGQHKGQQGCHKVSQKSAQSVIDQVVYICQPIAIRCQAIGSRVLGKLKEEGQQKSAEHCLLHVPPKVITQEDAQRQEHQDIQNRFINAGGEKRRHPCGWIAEGEVHGFRQNFRNIAEGNQVQPHLLCRY